MALKKERFIKARNMKTTTKKSIVKRLTRTPNWRKMMFFLIYMDSDLVMIKLGERP